VLAPDLLGFGFSDKPPDADYSIAAQADRVEALLRVLGIGRVHVLAHAYGVSVAQELLARRRGGTTPLDSSTEGAAAIRSVCLVSGGLFPESNRTLGIQRVAMSALGSVLARVPAPFYPLFRRSFRGVFGSRRPPTEGELRTAWELVTRDRGLRLMPRLMGYLEERETHRERWVGALLDSPVPIGLVAGPDDPVAAGQIDRWRELLPGRAAIVLGSGVGHYPPWEDPEGLRDAYEEFRRVM